MVSSDGYIYEHEVGYAYDSAVPFAESGPVELLQATPEQSQQRLVPSLPPEDGGGEADLVSQQETGPPAALRQQGGHHLRSSAHRQRGQRVTPTVVAADAASPGARRGPQLVQLRPTRRQLQQFDGAACAPRSVRDNVIASLSRG